MIAKKIQKRILVFLLAGILLLHSTVEARSKGPKKEKASRRILRQPHHNKNPDEYTRPKPTAMPEYRLPTSLIPTHQLIQLQPFIYVGNFTFDGYTEITFDVISATSNITIHQRNLTIDETLTTVEQVGGGAAISVVSQTYDFDKEFFIIDLDQNLVAGQSYILTVTYVGPLNDYLAYGCYEGRYEDSSGSDVYYSMSDFEPLNARNCYPSFDEPAMKANFTTRIIREDDLLSASNGKLLTSTQLGNGWTLDEFETTVRMSTYLNAFHVSDFSFTSTSSNGTDYDVYCRPGFENSTAYALYLGPAITEAFEAKFNVPYAMSKQDMIALSEYNSGAMENWGFITYRDDRLLTSSEVSTIFDQQGACEVISHELAHQWFGNLVTMEWWTNLWLNEGFASYYEYVGCGLIEQDYDEKNIYIVDELHYVLGVDDVQTSNPLVYDLDHPDEVVGMFNTITYSKGSAIVRMMQYFLTQPSFEAGLESYLRTYGFSNALQDDLFEVLNDQAMLDGTLDSSLTVKEIMDTWTLQMGYPVVTVTRSSADDGTATLTQERFLIRYNPNITDSNDYKWYIPITYTSQSVLDFVNFDELWMTPDDTQLTISGLPPLSEWVIFNIQEGGYFRVNYDMDNWNALIAQLNADFTVIDVKNRAQIINDAFNLATAGIISYDVGFGASEYTTGENHYVPIEAALEELEKIEELLRRDSQYGSFKNYIFQIVQPHYDNGSSGTPYLDRMLTSLTTSWACYLGYEPCLTESSSLYSQWMNSPGDHSIISTDTKATVYCAGVQQGSVAEWDFAYDQYLISRFTDEQYRLLDAMGCATENWLLTRYLDMAFDASSGIDQSRTDSVIEAVSESILGEDIAWDYVRANDVTIASYMGSAGSVAAYVLIISRKFSTNERLTQLEDYRTAFVSEFGSGPWVNPIDTAIANTQNNIDWMSDNYDEVITWLNSNGY